MSSVLRRRRRRRIPWFLIVIVVVVGALLGAGTASYLFGVLHTTHTSIGQLISPPFEGKQLVRVLALGEDETAKSRKNGRGLSDTLIVLALDLDKKTVRGLSIPRDTRVEIPGHGMQKINSAYTFGGPELTKTVAQNLLGVEIDYYVKTNIAGLKNIVDMVGGVGIEVEKDMHYTDRRGGLYIRLKKGYRHLDGDKALQYVRFRHDALGDITRIQRQQKFLRAIAREMLAVKNLTKLPTIVSKIYDNQWVETTMSAKDLVALAKLARDVRPEEMQMGMVPGAPQNIGGGSYWIHDPAQMRMEVEKLLYFTDPKGQQVKVEVLNGCGIPGVAQQVADKLKECGYTVTGTGNADRFDYADTQIIVRKGAMEGIHKLAGSINCTHISEENAEKTTSADVTVIVGRNNRSL